MVEMMVVRRVALRVVSTAVMKVARRVDVRVASRVALMVVQLAHM